MHVPWVEKYRPRTLDEVAHQDEVVRVLTAIVRGSPSPQPPPPHERQEASTGSAAGQAAVPRADNLPHLLFYGPPGTGKTSTALALCRQLFHVEQGASSSRDTLYHARVLELNASDERGIRVVREKIKRFARGAVDETRGDVPPFKVVILDEADAITADAQTALRRTMELYARHTRFILICNYISRVIAPVASRCAKFRFRPLSRASVVRRLREIAASEGVATAGEDDDAVLGALVDAAEGDLRKAVMSLQSSSRFAGADGLSEEVVAEAACIVPSAVIDRMAAACRITASSGDDSGGTEFSRVRACVMDEVIGGGYAADQVLKQLFDRLVSGESALDDVQRAAIAIAMAETEKRLADRADESLQLMGFGTRAMSIGARRYGDVDALVSSLGRT